MKAFPSSNEVRFGDIITKGHAGMDLRDYFAAKAMQSLCQAWISTENQLSFSEVAKASYNAADAMMEARTK